jgi:hypothetical protein
VKVSFLQKQDIEKSPSATQFQILDSYFEFMHPHPNFDLQDHMAKDMTQLQGSEGVFAHFSFRDYFIVKKDMLHFYMQSLGKITNDLRTTLGLKEVENPTQVVHEEDRSLWLKGYPEFVYFPPNDELYKRDILVSLSQKNMMIHQKHLKEYEEEFN